MYETDVSAAVYNENDDNERFPPSCQTVLSMFWNGYVKWAWLTIIENNLTISGLCW